MQKWITLKDFTMADYYFTDGDVIGDYEVLERLGKGVSGEVYLVRHQLLGQLKAMKIIMSDKLFTDPVMKERFLREARIAATIQHPNLVEVSNVSQVEDLGMSYIIMEYVEGESLKDYILRTPEISVDYALSVVHDVASALDAISRHGVIHRDIKPANIMISKKGGVKLADLGIAKVSSEAEFNDIAAKNVTLDNVVIGTPAYASPEQCRNASKVDVRSDIYSLGMCFYEMLTRTIPFESTSVMGMLEEVLFKEVPPVDQIRPDVPKEVCDFCMKMIAREPEKRPQTPAEVMETVDSLLASLKEKVPAAAPQSAELRIRPATSASPAASAPATIGGLKPLKAPRMLTPPKMLKTPISPVSAKPTDTIQVLEQASPSAKPTDTIQVLEQASPSAKPVDTIQILGTGAFAAKTADPARNPELETPVSSRPAIPTLPGFGETRAEEEVIISSSDDERYRNVPFSWKNLPAMVLYIVTKLYEITRTSLREFRTVLILCICCGGAVSFGLSSDIDSFVGSVAPQGRNISSFRAYKELPDQMSEKKRKQYYRVLAGEGDWESILLAVKDKDLSNCIKVLGSRSEPDACLIAATLKMMYPNPKGKADDFLPLMEKAANLGSLEAAGFLQTWYGCEGKLDQAEKYEKLCHAITKAKQKR